MTSETDSEEGTSSFAIFAARNSVLSAIVMGGGGGSGMRNVGGDEQARGSNDASEDVDPRGEQSGEGDREEDADAEDDAGLRGGQQGGGMTAGERGSVGAEGPFDLGAERGGLGGGQ